jgi:hypothetical protein
MINNIGCDSLFAWVEMNEFKNIWNKFEHVIDEMRTGMGFFEGFILNVSEEKIEAGIRSLCSAPFNAKLELSTWSNESTKEEWGKSYKTEEYLEFYRRKKIITLQPEYLTYQNDFELHLKLMIEKWEAFTVVEIICYRDQILDSIDPKRAVKAAINEFIRLKNLFEGTSLFIGPDTLNYPENDETYPEEWIKIID